MPKIRTLIAAGILAATALVATPGTAHAVGNYKCDTNSPQWNVDMCVRTNASAQTDGSGYRLDTVRVWATGNPATLEDCEAFITRVYLRKADGTNLSWHASSACKSTDYSTTVNFGGHKFGNGAQVVVWVQMYDNAAVDPPAAWITLDAVD